MLWHVFFCILYSPVWWSYSPMYRLVRNRTESAEIREKKKWTRENEYDEYSKTERNKCQRITVRGPCKLSLFFFLWFFFFLFENKIREIRRLLLFLSIVKWKLYCVCFPLCTQCTALSFGCRWNEISVDICTIWLLYWSQMTWAI